MQSKNILEIIEKNEKWFKVEAESWIEQISILQNQQISEIDRLASQSLWKYMNYQYLKQIVVAA